MLLVAKMFMKLAFTKRKDGLGKMPGRGQSPRPFCPESPVPAGFAPSAPTGLERCHE
jgi:hypothetical protein